MNRAGEGVKGATSARQLSGPHLGQPGDRQSWAAPAASRKPQRGWPQGGVVKSLAAAMPENRRSSHRRIFL